MSLITRVAEVTERITRRSETTRAAYRERIAGLTEAGRSRQHLSCGNLAHALAASEGADKRALAGTQALNIGIVSAYNDMLSAHQPYADYPQQIRKIARTLGATAQVAGGVPAMCDGVTQGRPGMELSLFSRDVIALGTAVALSHDAFDATICLGICDKIVPGLLIGALSFGHLPTIFIPAGPMPSGLPNAEKVRVRQLYTEGKLDKAALFEAECASYHSAGTCTFYGTANSNQMLMEIMGLQLPGSAFVNPGTPLRSTLTDEAVRQLTRIAAPEFRLPLAEIVTEKSLVNGMVGLLASGGSTNHTIHLIAMARAAGIILNWDDLSALSEVVPLLCRIYPNGAADVNQFHAAGGMPFLIRELRAAGLVHDDVSTVMGRTGLAPYARQPTLDVGALLATSAGRCSWQDSAPESGDDSVLRRAEQPFQNEGGLKLLKGNLGRAVIKTSAVKPELRRISAPARVFDSQAALHAAFQRGELERDFIAVVRFQGPKANGMPELHELTPVLGSLQDRGYKVALVTDGRMSGASGKVPAAIHLTPEACEGGAIARIVDGDPLTLDAESGLLQLRVAPAILAARTPAGATQNSGDGCGRELFANFRHNVTDAEHGAHVFGWDRAPL